MRSSSFLLVLLAAFGGGFALSSCGPTGSGTCSANTCGGCCDSSGKCQPGTAAAACGVEGATCGRCGSGTVCAQGTCSALGSGGGEGGGGGTTATGGGTTTTGGGTAATGGGSSGTGGAGGGGCRQVTALTLTEGTKLEASYTAFSAGGGHYNKSTWAAPGLTPSTPDGFRIEVVYPNDVGPTPPVTQNFTAVGYRGCSVCAVYYENCDQTLTCAKTFLARSGSVSLTRADKLATGGTLAGSVSGVHFVEWDLLDDVASGNGCVDFTGTASFTASW